MIFSVVSMMDWMDSVNLNCPNRISRSHDAAFLRTMPPPSMPWTNEACFTRLLMHEEGNKPAFHRLDLFHTVQLGQGKAFCSSALVTLLPLFEGSSVDTKLATLTRMYKEYCSDSCLIC